MSDENRVKAASRLGASQAGACTFANPSGIGWVGKHVNLRDGAIMIQKPRRQAFGLGVANKRKGSPDEIGWVSVIVTPEMVGQRIAIFVGIECKDLDGSLTEEQAHWMIILRDAGARCGVARSGEDAHKIVTGEKVYDPAKDNKPQARSNSRRPGTS